METQTGLGATTQGQLGRKKAKTDLTMQSCSQLCWQGGHVLPHQPQQPPPCRAPCLHCPSLAFPCHLHHISEVSFQGFISGMDGEGIFFTGRGKTKNLWGGRGGTRIVEPAWLWYSFPELRNRKETESSLGEDLIHHFRGDSDHDDETLMKCWPIRIIKVFPRPKLLCYWAERTEHKRKRGRTVSTIAPTCTSCDFKYLRSEGEWVVNINSHQSSYSVFG